MVAEVRNGEDIIDTKIARLRDAQPDLCRGVRSEIRPCKPELAAFRSQTPAFIFPEDRSVAESVRLGRDMARAVPS
jgi:hypothetical protein